MKSLIFTTGAQMSVKLRSGLAGMVFRVQSHLSFFSGTFVSCLFPESAVEAWSIVIYMQTSDLTLSKADHSQQLPFSGKIVDVNGRCVARRDYLKENIHA